ncbi:zinc finger CCCH domain-containing protein 13-like [Haliotis rubra]|uniref:zinc finger CCCH domain-containing protein 13-like n=1 Tax=Haliotis rubra TaxID=36100 RepID=UPI001EE5F3F7|nr:zinc finger CCCH domain-containing protein 13-like [Haliotis rubra]
MHGGSDSTEQERIRTPHKEGMEEETRKDQTQKVEKGSRNSGRKDRTGTIVEERTVKRQIVDQEENRRQRQEEGGRKRNPGRIRSRKRERQRIRQRRHTDSGRHSPTRRLIRKKTWKDKPRTRHMDQTQSTGMKDQDKEPQPHKEHKEKDQDKEEEGNGSDKK